MFGDLNDIRDRISLMAAVTDEPVIDGTDLDRLLRMARRVDLFGNPPNAYNEWEANVHYEVGDQVVSVAHQGDQFIPLVRNGFFYTVTVAGDSGGTEPAWPVASGTVADGTVTWAYTGVAPWNPTYDVNYAISQAWLLKTTRLAGHYNFMSGGRMFSREQFFNHCMTLHKKFAAKSGVKTFRLGTHSPLSASSGRTVETNAD